MPTGLEDVSKLPAITAALLDRGHTPDTVLKVLGQNLLRVMREVERAAGQPG
jgi:membrane dipeptidase